MDATWITAVEAQTEEVTTEAAEGTETGGGGLSTAQSLCCFFGTVGFFSNVFVLVVILKTASMRKIVTTFFILHQSAVDTIAALMMIASILPDSKKHFSQSTWDQFVCIVWQSDTFTWSMFMISSLNLTAIALERLVAVWKPMWHKASFTKGKRAAILAIIWTVGIIIPVGHAVVDGEVSASGECLRGVGGKANVVIGFIQVGFEFVIPVTVIAISYGMIIYILQKQNRAMARHNNMINIQSGKNVHGGTNIIKTVALVCILFVLCWTPNEVYYIMYLSGASMDWNHPFYFMSVNFVLVNCCCNPFVYILKYKDFQMALKRWFRCWNVVGRAPQNP